MIDDNSNKRILLVYYSQTGRSSRLAQSFCAPLQAYPDIEVTELALKPAESYPFPWPFLTFLDTFPETVQLRPPALAPFYLPGDERFDLIVLAYTVWFLSPAPPITGFVTSETGQRLLADTPVVTLGSCRNMWLNAHDTLSRLLRDAGARHCDNVMVTDPGPSLATFVTTPRWMLTGRRDRLAGLPAAGISEDDIAAAGRFGHALVDACQRDALDGRSLLTGLRAAPVDDRLLASERIGHRSFQIWSRLIRAFGGPGARARRPALVVYSVFLVLMIVTVVPLSLLLRRLLRPFQKRRAATIRARYASPSGDGDERMREFTP